MTILKAMSCNTLLEKPILIALAVSYFLPKLLSFPEFLCLKKSMLNKKKPFISSACAYMCVVEYRWRSEVKVASFPLLSLSIFCFESGSLPGVGARWFSWTDYLASLKDALASYPQHSGCRHTAHPAIYVGARDLDSGLYFTNRVIPPTTYTSCLLISPDSASCSLAQKFFLVLKSTSSWV